MSDIVIVKNISRRFGSTYALHDVSFSLPEKGIVGILGASGSGKSTLLNILSGLDVGYEGEVRVLNMKYRKAKEARRRRFRLKNIGYVFQNFNLLELETALMNVLIPMDAQFEETGANKKRKALDLLSFFGMEKKAKQKVNTLSGGEKQRVALARALANDPKILLCDEPTGALDEARAEEVFLLLRRIASDRLVILVSHDKERTLRHCERVLHMKDGRLVQETRQEVEKNETAPKSFLLRKTKGKQRICWRYLFLHAFHLMKAKRLRTLIAEGAIAMGLSGLGLSTYISGSISEELNAAFSTIVPPSAVVMSPRGGGESPLGSIYGASLEECEYIVEEYGDMVRDYGTDLHLDYESWFAQRNDFTYWAGMEQKRLSGFSMRHVNEFLWLDDIASPVCYPRTPATLYVDQIVLGLPYETMFQTCLNLHILRNYQSLGDYIDSHGFELILNLANESYGFEDEELFTVTAVMESEVPTIYHLDHRWNRKILLDQLRFRFSFEEATPNPQYVFEIPYLHLDVPFSEFLRLARRDEALSHLLYERANETYLPTQCTVGTPCKQKRLYLYGADKTGVGFAKLDEIMDLCPEIAGREVVSVGGYYAESGSLAMGFMGKFFLCGDYETAEGMVDFYSDLPLESAHLPGEMLPRVKDGSVLAAGSGGLRLSSDLSILPAEQRPKSCEECALSKGLWESWGRPKEVYVAAEISSEEVGRSYVRHFGIAPIKVTVAADAAYDTLFVMDDWTVDFFLEELGMSSFYLEPYGAVFSLKEGADAKAVVERLGKTYGDFSFSNPAEEIASSIASTLSYISTILGAFSAFALAMSALLFLIVMTISINENAGEARMLSVLGLSQKDIARSYHAQCLIYASGALLSSLAMMVAAEMMTKVYIASTFHAKASLSIPLAPLGACALACLGFTFFIMLGISANLRLKICKKDAKRI